MGHRAAREGWRVTSLFSLPPALAFYPPSTQPEEFCENKTDLVRCLCQAPNDFLQHLKCLQGLCGPTSNGLPFWWPHLSFFYAILSNTTLLAVSWTFQAHTCFRAIIVYFCWLALPSSGIPCDSLQDVLRHHPLCTGVPGHLANVLTAPHMKSWLTFLRRKILFSILLPPSIIFYIRCHLNNIFTLIWAPWG